MKKNNKGITMIQMVITIVMMVLIAGFSIYNARDTIIETKVAKIYNEVEEVKNAVTGLKIFEDENIENILGAPLQNLNDYSGLAAYYKDDQEYYLLNFKTNGNTLCDLLEIRNIENNYIVNLKDVDNVEVFLVGGAMIENEMCYTDYEILKKYNDIFAGRK